MTERAVLLWIHGGGWRGRASEDGAALAVHGLRVCWEGPQKDRNCGVCVRCVGTAILWSRTLKFAICVIGVSLGIRVWEIERFLLPDQEITANIVVLEAYKTLLRTAQANLAMVVVIGLAIGVVVLMKPREAPKDQDR